MKSVLFSTTFLVAFAPVTAALAGDYDDALTELAGSTLNAWVQDPVVMQAIKDQNADHAALSEGDIVALDNTWRGEVGAGSAPLINEVLSRPVSQFLTDMQDSAEGVVTEVFVMDNRGLNVGQSSVTSDYWQGDEAKWQETFGAGAGAIHISEVEFDESTQTYQVQLSMAITDPANDEVLGAVTFGVDVGLLE